MKKGIYKRVIYFGVLLVMSLCITGCFKKEVKIGTIKNFHYSYSVGYAMNCNYEYDIKWNEDKLIARIKPNGVADENATIIDIKEDDLRDLEEILKELRIGKWDGFKKSDKNVLDGNSFSLNIDFTDGTEIDASGYMKWPNNYKEFKDKVAIYFEDLLAKNKKKM